MRIITGSARGTTLKTLPGEETTRPTAERVKEAMFSAVQFELGDRVVLELFGGCRAAFARGAFTRGSQRDDRGFGPRGLRDHQGKRG